MTMEQYDAFVDLIPAIERVLKSKGFKVPRPQYDKKSTSPEVEADKDSASEEDEAEESEEEEKPTKSSPKHKGKLDKFKMKKSNHEATDSSEEG